MRPALALSPAFSTLYSRPLFRDTSRAAELNYSLLSRATPCKILKMADVRTPNNRATCANDNPISFVNRSAISEPPRGISPRRLPILSEGVGVKSTVDASLEMLMSIFVQHFPHFSCQPLHCKRFLDVIDSFFHNSMTNNSMIGIA